MAAFPWVNALTARNSDIISLAQIERLQSLKPLNLSGLKIKNFSGIEQLTNLEVINLSRVNCSELDVVNSIVKNNPKLYDFRLNNSQLTQGTIDGILSEFDLTKEDREQTLWANMFFIDLRKNSAPSGSGGAIAASLAARGWTVLHDQG